MHFRRGGAWQVAVIFSKLDPAIHKHAIWFDHQIRVSVRPGESWEDAYVRQFHELPEKKFRGFISVGM